MTQMCEDFECESQLADPRHNPRQVRREAQLVRLGKALEKKLRKLYRVPEDLTLARKLQHARDRCGMPPALFGAADTVRIWRNMSAHAGHGHQELPETDEPFHRVIGRMIIGLKDEEARLGASVERRRMHVHM